MEPVTQVPEAIEHYLVELMVHAGRLGGSLGGGSAGGRGGAKGAARAAKRLRTVVVERQHTISRSADVGGLCKASFDRTIDLDPGDSRVRFAVFFGRTGLQQVVVDLVVLSEERSEARVILRAYAKEGWLSRHPAQRVADQAIAALRV